MNDVYAPPQAVNHPAGQAHSSEQLKKALRGEYQLRLNATFSEAWDLTKGMKWRTHLALLLYSLVPIAMVIALSMGVGLFFFANSSETMFENMFSQDAIGFKVASDAYSIISGALFMSMYVGLSMIGLKRATGRHFYISESYRYFHFFRPLFVFGLVVGVISFLMFSAPFNYHIGFVLFSLPGLFFFVSLMFTGLLVVDKNLPVLEAMQTSFRVIRHRWFKFFGLYLLIMFWNILGSITLLIGLFWTIPMTLNAFGIVYRDVFGAQSNQA